jgi:diaminopimelate epimerase
MEVYNADGSQAEMCGNGLRCAAKLAWDHKRLRDKRSPQIATGAGILRVDLRFDGEDCNGAQVAMGKPRLDPADIPVVHAGPGPLLELQIEGQRLLAVGMGNPHAVCFVDDAMAIDLARIGPALEHHAVFPRRANIEFVSRLPDEDGLPVLRQRTWERGSGETLACGTGACAVTVAAILDKQISGRSAIIRLNGGDLRIDWPDDHASVLKTGPARFVFTGNWTL